MELCTVCEKPAQYIEIEGGNYYCVTDILGLYGYQTEGEE